jgi:hypothetical protein
MASPLAAEATALQRLLHQRGRTHLSVSARGSHLTVYSGTQSAPEPRIRLSRLPGAQYGVSFPAWSGRWEPTPFSGSLTEVLETVEAHFGFHLDP